MFSKITYKKMGSVPASINRTTGELFINPSVWNDLNPDQKQIILLHEEGHLKLLTPDEFTANKYAIEQYLPDCELTDSEFNRRVTVLTRTFAKSGPMAGTDDDDSDQQDPDISNSDGLGFPAIGAFLGQIVQTLPALGIGSKSRIREMEKQAKAQQNLMEAQNKFQTLFLNNITNMIIILSVLALVVIVVYRKYKNK